MLGAIQCRFVTPLQTESKRYVPRESDVTCPGSDDHRTCCTSLGDELCVKDIAVLTGKDLKKRMHVYALYMLGY